MKHEAISEPAFTKHLQRACQAHCARSKVKLFSKKKKMLCQYSNKTFQFFRDKLPDKPHEIAFVTKITPWTHNTFKLK